MPEPLISVIMPAYNAAQFIEESILSVTAQTYVNWELIIVNDGSTDGTAAIAHKYVLLDKRVKLITQSNKKLSAARNAGMANATGEWIAFIDADDLWVADKLAKQVEVVQANPNVGVIFSDGFTFSGSNTGNNLPYGTVSGVFSGAEMYQLEYQGNYIPVLSALVKKTDANAAGLQDETLMACEDWDYWLRLALQGVWFYGMSDRLFYYRKHASNMSNDNSLMSFSKASVFLKNFKKELFIVTEIAKLKGFVQITICQLIKVGKIKDALFLNKQRNKITKGLGNFNGLLISMLKKRSYLFVRLVFKADMLLAKIIPQ